MARLRSGKSPERARKDRRPLGGARLSGVCRATIPLFCAEMILALFTIPPGHATRQGGIEPAAIETQKSPKNIVQLFPGPILPNSFDILVLIRATLLSFNDAVQTGNFTVLRDLAAPSFRELDSAELSEMFAGFMTTGIDLAPVAIMTPTLDTIAGTGGNRLRIRGHFSNLPMQIDFDLRFERIEGQWRLSSISVRPVDDTRPAPQQSDREP